MMVVCSTPLRYHTAYDTSVHHTLPPVVSSGAPSHLLYSSSIPQGCDVRHPPVMNSVVVLNLIKRIINCRSRWDSLGAAGCDERGRDASGCKGLPRYKHAAESRHCPCRPRAPPPPKNGIRVRIRHSDKVVLVWVGVCTRVINRGGCFWELK